jgi:hypothetical protein
MNVPVPEELHTAIGGVLIDQPGRSWRSAIVYLADQLLAAQRVGRGLQEDGA